MTRVPLRRHGNTSVHQVDRVADNDVYGCTPRSALAPTSWHGLTCMHGQGNEAHEASRTTMSWLELYGLVWSYPRDTHKPLIGTGDTE